MVTSEKTITFIRESLSLMMSQTWTCLSDKDEHPDALAAVIGVEGYQYVPDATCL